MRKNWRRIIVKTVYSGEICVRWLFYWVGSAAVAFRVVWWLGRGIVIIITGLGFAIGEVGFALPFPCLHDFYVLSKSTIYQFN